MDELEEAGRTSSAEVQGVGVNIAFGSEALASAAARRPVACPGRAAMARQQFA